MDSAEMKASKFLMGEFGAITAGALHGLTAVLDQHAAEQRGKDADLADEALLNQHPGKTMREVILQQEKSDG